MTVRLFHADPSRLRFTARVLEIRAGGHEAVLDRTAFYATSGGQLHDTGVLGGVPVEEVLEEGDTLVHRLGAPLPLTPGSEVEGTVDAGRRRDLSRQHTGQHLLSAILADRFGLETVSVHLGETSSTLDVAAPALQPSLLAEVEGLANDLVAENRTVTIGEEEAGEAARRGLRKPSDRSGSIRVVTIEGVDRSACGGTHVEGTASIGPILLGETERIRGDTRVSFLCGDRALRRARADREALVAAARTLGATAEEVPGRVASLQERLRESGSAVRRLEGEVAELRARELHSASNPGPGGIRRILVEDPPDGMDGLQRLGQACAALPGTLLVGITGSPPGILVAAAEDTGLHAGDLLRGVLSEVGGRGGGSPRVARGTAPDAGSLREVAARLAEGAG